MRKNHGRFIITLIFLPILLALFVQPVKNIVSPVKDKADPPSPQQIPFNITLTWTQEPATTQTITWQTKSADKGLIKLTGETGYTQLFHDPVIKNAALEKLVSLTGESLFFYSATLTGLTPDTKYLYRVGDGKTWSKKLSFTTAEENATAFQFLVFGDSQSYDDYAIWKRTLQGAVKLNPQAEFFVNVGDLVDQGLSLTQWNDWFKAGQGVIDHISAMPLRGNHDSYKPYWSAFFRLPLNGPPDLKGLTYAFDYGPVHFVMLDDLAESDAELLASQSSWLQKDLSTSFKPWKIVFFHRPYYSNVSGRANTYLRNAYEQILNQNQVALVFNGHDHVLARTFPIINGKIVKESAKGTLYFLTGRSGTKSYKNAQKASWDHFFHNPISQPNYLSVRVTGQQLRITAYHQDGSVIDNFVIHRQG